MAGEVISRELLEELEMAGRDPRKNAQKKKQHINDPVAYRMGRNATQVRASFLNAKLRQFDDQISSWIVTLNARKDELHRQTKDVFAWSGHGLAMLIGFSILATALAVDYMIIHEFWSRVLSNEFGEVPKSLASSVMFKSAQVIFATLAFHFMLETVGNIGRRIFILMIFALTFVMLLGIGLIIANSWLPPGSELFGIDLKGIADQGQNMLASIGLGSAPATAAGTQGPVNADDVRTVQTLVWLGSLSAIFIIVTGVGALCMRFGIHGFQGIFGEITFDTRHGGAARLGFRKDELVRVKSTLAHFKDPKSRWRILERHLSDFVTSYSDGIRAYESAMGDVGRFFKRDVTAQTRLEQLEQAVRQVEQQWTLEDVRRRHAVDEFDEPSTAVDADADSRKEPGFGSNVLDMFNHNNRRNGTDD